jgi:hypothetical protein
MGIFQLNASWDCGLEDPVLEKASHPGTFLSHGVWLAKTLGG